MENWTEKPTEITNWPNDVDYVLCLDENGGEGNLKAVKKQLKLKKEVNINDKYFTLTGVILDKQNYVKLAEKMELLKQKYWESGLYKYNDIDKKVCFHTREINKKEGPFYKLSDKYDLFLQDLTNLIENTNFKIVSMSIDIEEYLKNQYNDEMYDKAMDYMIEQFNNNIPENKNGIIILEGRGKKEDTNLHSYIKTVLFQKGIEYTSQKDLSNKIKGIYFNTKWHTDTNNTYIGLELADLVSYPIYKYVKFKKKDQNFKSIENKILGYPELIQNGIKIFP